MKKFLLISLCFVSFLINKASSQNFDWVKTIEYSGTSTVFKGTCKANACITDKYGNIIITGFFDEIHDFDPGPGIHALTPNGLDDAYICKYDSSGNFKWVVRLSGNFTVEGLALTTDDSGNVYNAGTFEHSISGLHTDSGYTYMTYVCKIDSNGTVKWLNKLGGTKSNYGAQDDAGVSVGVDKQGNVYTTGQFTGKADMDPFINGTYYLTAQGYDVFVSKLDPLGKFVWAKGIGGSPGGITCKTNMIDTNGNIYLAGFFEGKIDFNPGPSTYNLISAGDDDAFICKLNNFGNLLWAHKFGNSDRDRIKSICLDDSSNIYCAGSFHQTVDFDPGSGTHNLTPVKTSYNAFVGKYSSNGQLKWVKQFSGYATSRSIGIDRSNNIYVSGAFSDTVDFNPGIGIFELYEQNWDLYVCKLTNSGNFVWVAQLWSSLMVSYSLSIDDNYNLYLAGHYDGIADFDPGAGVWLDTTTSSGTDAYLLKLKPCIINGPINTIAGCNDYTWNGTIYNTSGTYTQRFVASNGCDSIATISLTINNIDTSVTSSIGTLTANASSASFQWLNCNSGYATISGATNAGFTPSTNGSYAVQVTQGGCIDTSNCYTIANVGLSDNALLENAVSFFPNPSNGNINIQINNNLLIDLNIYSSLGELVFSRSQFNNTSMIDLSELSSGIYIAHVSSEGKTVVLKLVLEK